MEQLIEECATEKEHHWRESFDGSLYCDICGKDRW